MSKVVLLTYEILPNMNKCVLKSGGERFIKFKFDFPRNNPYFIFEIF